MTKWLASVQSLEEAKALSLALPDILDLKNPAAGALGALSIEAVTEIVDWVAGRCLTSATVGDLEMQAGIIAGAVKAMAATDVDYIKVGLFADPQLAVCLDSLKEKLADIDKPVIAVLFADQPLDLSLLPAVKQAGFSGVMVDTATKNGQGLLEHWSVATVNAFINQARELGLLCGLAGALRIEDIDTLEPLGADYLGFRSALCDKQQRTSTLQAVRARAIQQRLHHFGLAS